MKHYHPAIEVVEAERPGEVPCYVARCPDCGAASGKAHSADAALADFHSRLPRKESAPWGERSAECGESTAGSDRPNGGETAVEGEMWRDVPGWEGLYSVSNLGRVRSEERIMRGKGNKKRRRKQMILSGYTNSRGHRKMRLSDGRGGLQEFPASHLVAFAFLPGEKPPGWVVVHENGDNADDRVENLRYAPRKEVALRAAGGGVAKSTVGCWRCSPKAVHHGGG